MPILLSVDEVIKELRLPSAYLAPVSWYAALAAAERVVIEQHEHYVKQTFRNRCRIAMPDGAMSLVVPVEAGSMHTDMKDVRISDHGNWRHHHWNALRTAYGKSPFFEFYADDFAPFYEKKYPFLVDFNEALREVICETIGLGVSVSRSTSYKAPMDFASLVSLSPCVAKSYYQIFSQRLGFLYDLSIIDLLFNLGPEALLYLTQD